MDGVELDDAKLRYIENITGSPILQISSNCNKKAPVMTTRAFFNTHFVNYLLAKIQKWFGRL
jgi:hypothetical protein